MGLKMLLMGLIRSTRHSPIKLPVHFGGWAPSWPFFASGAAPSLHLVLDAGGFVDMSPFKAMAPMSASAQKMWTILIRDTPSIEVTSKPFDVVTLLCIACKKDCLGPLFFELAYSIALSVESAVTRALTGKDSGSITVTTSYINVLDLLQKPRELDRELLRLVLSSREASKNNRRFALCCDKANVAGMTLHNGVVGMPGNVLSLAAPQALGGVPRCLGYPLGPGAGGSGGRSEVKVLSFYKPPFVYSFCVVSSARNAQTKTIH